MVRPVQKKTTDTTGLDTSIITNITLQPTVPVETGFAKASTKSAGISKAAGIFYKILFTDVGSNPLNREEGTNLTDLFESNISDSDVLFAFVNNQVDEAFIQLQEIQEQAEVSEEEQIANVSIVNFFADSAKSELTFGVNLFSASGEKTTLQIPSIVLA